MKSLYRVAKKKYSLAYHRIAGYGRPKYALAEDKKMLETGNDIVWELMNGNHKITINDPAKAIKAIDEAKNHPEFLSLYWIIHKIVNNK